MCCAERRTVSFLRELSRKHGVQRARFTHWAYRKFGRLIIERVRKDGEPGTSLPCVICRKVLDRLQIQWTAHINDTWVTNYDAPPSKPTTKQRLKWSPNNVASDIFECPARIGISRHERPKI
jgi:hypothetical protein